MVATTHETRFLLSAKDRTAVAFKTAKTNLDGIKNAVTGVHAKILGLAGIGGLGALFSGIVRTNAEMQTLKTSLKTVTGSTEAAAKAFTELEQFAIETPFDLNEWVDGFIKMKALGLDPSREALTAYGNTASAMGKSLNQMIEAVADAATGEFERLKEFGIRASKEGDRVKFTFQGVTTTVGNSAAEITQYLQSIGNNEFGGAMDEQAKTLTASFSNLRGAFAKLAVSLGEAGLNDLVRDLTVSITNMANSVKPDDVKRFFDEAKSGAMAAYDTINGMPHLAEMGLIGFALFGKKGLALAAGVSFLSGKLGEDIGKAWEEWNPSQVVAGSGGFTGNAGVNPMPGYQLGDLNRSNGRLHYLDLLKDIESRYGSKDDKAASKLDQTNQQLREMTDILRDQRVAVAG
jgi:hypothetical protein